jgi:hypothetical protein
MPAGEEDIYVLYASASNLVDDLHNRSMETVHWSHMLQKAFDKKYVGALNTASET